MPEVSRVVDGVGGAPGGTSGNFQSRARTINLQAAVLLGAIVTGAQKKKKKNYCHDKLTVHKVCNGFNWL
jgi:hypothetical protein